MKKKSQAVTRKNEIGYLVSQYSIEDIESALIEAFLERKSLTGTKNSFLNSLIKNTQQTKEIRHFLSQHAFVPDLKNIERIFELLIPEKDRSLNGAFYTPINIVNYLVDKTITGDVRVCDPATGSGAFLVGATKKIRELTQKKIVNIIQENIYGLDILDYSIKRCKIILSLLALEHGEDQQEIRFNLYRADSLTEDWSKLFPEIISDGSPLFSSNERGFDVVISNPPYVRIQDLPETVRAAILKKWDNINTGSFNLHFAFFELGMKILKTHGKLGFIVPNNIFTSLSAKKLRSFLQDNRYIQEIVDFNHLLVFEDATTYTCLTLLEKSTNANFRYALVEDYASVSNLGNLSFSCVDYASLNPAKWRLLLDSDKENIMKIANIGARLGSVAKIRSGIATLKDSLYFVDGSHRKDGFIIKKIGEKEYLIEPEITRAVVKISSMQDDSEVSSNSMRIIFPYKKIGDKFAPIPPEELNKNFPKVYEYFVSVKDQLASRDKGKAKQTDSWYVYGRDQGLFINGKKLITPTFSKHPRFMYLDDPDALFCNGYAVLPINPTEIGILKKILNSAVMDYYMRRTSVNIEGGFPCYQKNFIENFGIPRLGKDEAECLEKEQNKGKINDFLINKYGLERNALLKAGVVL